MQTEQTQHTEQTQPQPDQAQYEQAGYEPVQYEPVHYAQATDEQAADEQVDDGPVSPERTGYEPTALPQAQPLVVNVPARPVPRGLRGSIARILLIGLAIIVSLVVLIVGGFSLLKSTRSQPQDIERYPNTTIISQQTASNSDDLVFSSADPIDRVADFYSRRLGSSSESGCKQIFLDAQPSTDAGHSYYRCIVDSSMLEMQQTLQVTITYDPASFHTLIEVARRWGAQ